MDRIFPSRYPQGPGTLTCFSDDGTRCGGAGELSSSPSLLAPSPRDLLQPDSRWDPKCPLPSLFHCTGSQRRERQESSVSTGLCQHRPGSGAWETPGKQILVVYTWVCHDPHLEKVKSRQPPIRAAGVQGCSRVLSTVSPQALFSAAGVMSTLLPPYP